jgi:hypothetical protein
MTISIDDMQRALPRLILAAALAVPAPAEAKAISGDPVGAYVLTEGPDAAGRLELTADGRFAYAMSVGALDEVAQGRWVLRGGQACLTTEPTPRPPEFMRLTPRNDQQSQVLVETEHGRGIPGVDVIVGFDVGEPVTWYTQYYGWSLPEDEQREPRWVQLFEPIHRFASQRLTLAPEDRGRIRATIVVNDLGVVDFRDACLQAEGDGFVLHRDGGGMRFRRIED